MSDRLQRFTADFVAGLTGAMVYIPQGVAYALVAGVSPAYALYTGIVAPIVGTLTAGSSFLVIIATNELAIPTGSILAGLGDPRLLFPLTFLVGAFQLLFGFLKFGNLTRFISESVMTGFITGVAVLLVLGQLDELTGYQPGAANVLLRTWELITNPRGIDIPTTLIGVITIAVILLLQKTSLKTLALIIAMIVASIMAQLLAQPSIKLISGIAEIPRTLPWPAWPDWRSLPGLIVPALSLAVVGLAVAAGVAQSYPERDGSLPDASRDFVGQGAANTVGSLFLTMPAGGSFSRTATSVSAGAQTRWANIFLGLILALTLLTVGSLTRFFPLSALAGLLIVIGFQALKPERIARVRHTHISERAAMIATFTLCLVIPLQYAIVAGVVLTLLLYLYSSASKIRVVEVVAGANDQFVEQPPPAFLPSDKVTMLHAYGNAFFAAVQTLEKKLPSIDQTQNAVLLYSMRGQDTITTTALAFLERFARKLEKGNNRLMLVGVEPRVMQQLEATGTVDLLGHGNIFPKTAELGGALKNALAAAQDQLARSKVPRPELSIVTVTETSRRH